MSKRRDEKKPADQDWHWADVMSALSKAGWSLRQLALDNGYPHASHPLGYCKRKPFPKAEAIIAAAIGTTPQAIWPTRYGSDGLPNRRRGPEPKRPTAYKDMPMKVVGNPQAQKAA